MLSYAKSTSLACIAMLAGMSSASHLDDRNGIFSDFTFDMVKFKTQTNCSLDKYPEVRNWHESSDTLLIDKNMARHWRRPVH